ncbi:class I SAM-dependent methyltransferase, partial [Candidatus Margulisiibacteriota bacterium]
MINKKLETAIVKNWDGLHSQPRFLPKYPSESVVRFVLTQFSHEAAERKRARILDLGCGGGRHTLLLAREGFKAYGTDISAKGLNFTKGLLKQKQLTAVLRRAPMEHQPFRNEFFDGIIAFASLYYNDFTGYKKAVAEIYRLLRKGGRALIVTRSVDDYRFGKGESLGKNTFLVDIPETNEKGLLLHFIGEKEIDLYFHRFS